MVFPDQQKSWSVPLSPPSSFVKHELPFPSGLKSRMHIGYRAVTVMCADRAE